MKNVIISTLSVIIASLLVLSLTACGSTPTKPSVAEPTKQANPATRVAVVHEQTVGSIQITYDDTGAWIKIVSSGSAPTHDKSPHSVSEATKVAAMHAKQNIAEFMSSDLRSNKDSKTTSKSKVHSSVNSQSTSDEDQAEKSDSDVETFTTVVENIKDNSAAILRGVYVTKRDEAEDSVNVEVTVTNQSIATSRSLQESMSR